MSYRGPIQNDFNQQDPRFARQPFPQQQQQAQQYPPSSYSYAANRPSRPIQQGEPFTIQLKHHFNSFLAFTDRIESLTTHPLLQRIEPYIPTISRFFIVATFYEDSLRILTQWSDQVFYLNKWKGIPYVFVLMFLLFIIIAMPLGSTLLIARKHTVIATGLLISCIVLQGVVYGLVSGSAFLLRNISVIGGLLIAFSDSMVSKKMTFGMLPELEDKVDKNKSFLLLVGRILIVLMFVGFTFSKSWVTVIFTIVFTVCFAIGFRIKFASIMLGLILTFYNVTLNNYWFYDSTKKDFLKYEFYQNLSIIGGLLLVINTGAGEISVDEKKKIY
ncbi:uncharacterized protein NDAI_0I02610 [Naumovozyma dairenensis CBS 421]|uniref:ER-derived vesicles protein ERV29 n=1 Tax=Naumovozyma dairenensis (strain ATCC 10597 / BCRC 20456 / CBS 421 / NBRC 0211 / NRRL Y-12639) TaxID=1071378 RepID=G0WGB8_NAUDC|nr:hypothetical protein NDAI_0I02610 [Naumovozyma dairenensis CBS 421]CCD26829.1 hypothetical protein NDAI_0I02610 [Naumovozyma dairenensis CBS 421]